MAPPAGRRIGDDFAGDSDSDVSITGLDDETTRAKGKGKGKAIDRSKKDKGKGKAKEVTIYYILSSGATTDMRMCSNHTLGRHHTLARGTLFRRTRRAG